MHAMFNAKKKIHAQLNCAQISTAHKTKIPTKKFNALSLSDVVFIKLINVKMPTIVQFWHFNIYEQDKFRAQLS